MNNQVHMNSAIVAYRPMLKGFFYSRFMDVVIRNAIRHFFRGTEVKHLADLRTTYGVSGLFMLPYTLKEIKAMPLTQRERVVGKAVLVASEQGAKKISFAGQLPSCLNYCESFSDENLQRERDKLTTGHSLTCLAVACTFEKVLRDTFCRTFAVVGTGSIGQSSIVLLLEKVMDKKPHKIILCDLKKKRDKVERFSSYLKESYVIDIEIVFYDDSSFENIYEADMILGASSAPHILSAKKLKKGAILIDDSFPPVIDVRGSIDRMRQKGDVVIMGGGKIDLPEAHIENLSRWIPRPFLSLFLKHIGREGFPGCWLESILFSWADENCPVEGGQYITKGIVKPDKLRHVWNLKHKLRLNVPPLHFYKYAIPQSLLGDVYSLRQSWR